MCETANAARRTKTIPCKIQRLADPWRPQRAIIALAHKLIRTIESVLVRRKPYHDMMIDYDAAIVAKNARRWIRAFKKYGFCWPKPATTKLQPATAWSTALPGIRAHRHRGKRYRIEADHLAATAGRARSPLPTNYLPERVWRAG